MTMLELQNALSQSLESVLDTECSVDERENAIASAEVVARLSKQMINNADVILRADKLSNRHDRIDQVVG